MHTHNYSQFVAIKQPSMRVYRLWEEAGQMVKAHSGKRRKAKLNTERPPLGESAFNSLKYNRV